MPALWLGVIGGGWGCVAGGSLGALEWEAVEALAAVGRAGVSAVVRTTGGKWGTRSGSQYQARWPGLRHEDQVPGDLSLLCPSKNLRSLTFF